MECRSSARAARPTAPAEGRGRNRSSLCAQQAHFVARTGQKIVLQRQLAVRDVQHLDVHRWSDLNRVAAEQPGGTVKHLSPQRRDLVGVNIILLRQFGQGLFTPAFAEADS